MWCRYVYCFVNYKIMAPIDPIFSLKQVSEAKPVSFAQETLNECFAVEFR